MSADVTEPVRMIFTLDPFLYISRFKKRNEKILKVTHHLVLQK